MRVYIIILLLLSAGTAYAANPVCDINRNQAYNDIKRHLTDRYAPSYSTVEMLLKANMEAYDKICRLPQSKDTNQILQHLNNRYYPSFSTILMLYEGNIASKQKLDSSTPPSQSGTPSRTTRSTTRTPATPAKWFTKGTYIGAKYEEDLDKAIQLTEFELNLFILENEYVIILPSKLEVEIIIRKDRENKVKISPVGESTTLWTTLDGIERR